MIKKRELQKYAENFIEKLDNAVGYKMGGKQFFGTVIDLGQGCPVNVVVFVIADKLAVLKRETVVISKELTNINYIILQMKKQVDGDPENLIHIKREVRLMCKDILYIMKPNHKYLWDITASNKDADEIIRTVSTLEIEEAVEDYARIANVDRN